MSSTVDNHQWYALRIRSRFEQCAAKHMKDKGYEEFLPLSKSTRRWSDRMKTLAIPLFPGYLFFKFDIQDRLPILIVPGSVVDCGAR